MGASVIGRSPRDADPTRFGFKIVGAFLAVALVLLVNAAPSQAQTGKLKVKAIPPQAYVFVDGKAIHEASKGSIALSPGEHTVNIYNYGYKPATQKVTINAGKTVDLDVKLDPVSGDVTGPWGCITIEKAARDAILLNGKTPDFFVGHGDEFDHDWLVKQELVVPPGTHQLTVLSGDKEVWSGSVNVPANQRVVIDIPKGVRKTVPWSRGEQIKSFARFKAGTASATVAVAKPTAQLAADKAQINCGESAQLKWSTAEAPLVEISDVGKVAGSGEQSVQPLHNTTYNLTASGPGGKATASATVAVNTAIQASLDLSPTEVKYRKVGSQVMDQGTANLNWNTSNASKISVDPFGDVAASGSRSIQAVPQKTSLGPVDETVTYTLTASNIAGTRETRTARLHITGSIEPQPEPPKPEIHVPLFSIYFPTALPTKARPDRGLLNSQQQTLKSLAADFKKYLEQKPEARLTLIGHADRRGTSKYNMALSERRVNRVKQVLVDNGIPDANIEVKALGKTENLKADQVKQLVEQQTNLSDTERKKLLRNLPNLVLAQNRRVDVVLSTTGEQSIRQYPFDATDAKVLMSRGIPSGSSLKKADPDNK